MTLNNKGKAYQKKGNYICDLAEKAAGYDHDNSSIWELIDDLGLICSAHELVGVLLAIYEKDALWYLFSWDLPLSEWGCRYGEHETSYGDLLLLMMSCGDLDAVEKAHYEAKIGKTH